GARVWRRDRGQRILQRLEPLNPRSHAPPAALTVELPALRDHRLRGARTLARQIREIRVVGNALDIERTGKPPTEIVRVLEGQPIATLALHAIAQPQFEEPLRVFDR